MTFTHPRGTRGGPQPHGPLVRWISRLAARRVRRTGRAVGRPALVLHTVGARSGQERTAPVACFPADGGGWLVVASAAGAPRNPAWYANLAVHPDRVRVEVEGHTLAVTPEELHGAERAAAWRQIVAATPQFASYETKTDREMPVIRLRPRDAS